MRHDAGELQPAGPGRHRVPWPAIGAVAAVLVLVAGAAVAIARSSSGPSDRRAAVVTTPTSTPDAVASSPTTSPTPTHVARVRPHRVQKAKRTTVAAEPTEPVVVTTTPAPVVTTTTPPPPPPTHTPSPTPTIDKNDAAVTIANTFAGAVKVTINGQTWKLDGGERLGPVSVTPASNGNDVIEVGSVDYPTCGMGDAMRYFEAGKSYVLKITTVKGACYPNGSDKPPVDGPTWTVVNG